jgi:arylsulfatase A-like enzyme
VPTVIRWPGVIKPDTIYNEMFAHEDFIPTFAAAGGDPDVVARCKKGCQSGNKSFKIHLDGYNLTPFFRGEVQESPRKEFLYWSDDGDLFAIRVQNWKIVFIEQNHTGIEVWRQGFNHLRIPKLFNLLADPFERGDTSMLYDNWFAHRAFVQVPARAVVAQWLESFEEFPIRQKPASFNLDVVMRKLMPTQ